MQEQVIHFVATPAARKAVLPAQFAERLNSYLAWALPTETQRSTRRHQSSMEEIHAFSAEMLAQLPEILAYLDRFAPDALPEEAQSLMAMVLSLAEVAPAIEFYQQQAVVDGFDYRRFEADAQFKLSPAL